MSTDDNKIDNQQLHYELRILRKQIAAYEKNTCSPTELITLEEEKRFISTVLNTVDSLVLVLNRKGQIVLFNRACEKASGYTFEELKGVPIWDILIPKEEMQAVRNVFAELKAGMFPNRYTNRWNTKSGDDLLISWSNTALLDDLGDVEFVVPTGLDITEQERSRIEKIKLESQIRQAHKMEAIGTLAGGIAHDFNNILAAILGYADMATDNIPDNSPAKSQIGQVVKAGNRAKELVKHILSFSRKETLERVPINIDRVVSEALKLIRASLPTTIKIKQNISSQCGVICADATQIHQIVMNLCTNAAQAMDESGGILDIELNSSQLFTDDLLEEPSLKPGQYVRLSIKDNGVGIEQKYIDRIFDPYFTTKGVSQGSGMGLAVVSGIVKSHEGVITVDSEQGVGTIFNVYFPMVKTRVKKKARDVDSLQSGTEKILIVDDEVSMVELTKLQIEPLGYQVTTQTSSKQALELFRSQPDAFDLVISDQTMPDLTGEKLATKMMEIRPNIPIIISSGYSPKMDAEKAAALGISAFIMKPTDKNELAQTIRRVLDN